MSDEKKEPTEPESISEVKPDQSLKRRDFLHSAIAASAVAGVVAANGFSSEASAQSHGSGSSGVFFRSNIQVNGCGGVRAIPVEADLFVFCRAGGGVSPGTGKDFIATKEYINSVAKRSVDTLGLLGLADTEDIGKITLTKDLPPNSIAAVVIGPGVIVKDETGRVFACYEDLTAMVSRCIQIGFEPFTPAPACW